MSHTPTPWRVGYDGPDDAVIFGEIERVADLYVQPAMHHNAAFIVKACNAHDELVAALERIVKRSTHSNDLNETYEDVKRDLFHCKSIAEQALSKVSS